MFLNLYQYFKLNDYIHDLVDLIVCLFFYILFFIRKLKQTQVKWVFFFSDVQHKSSINMSLILWWFNRYQCFFRLKLEQLI